MNADRAARRWRPRRGAARRSTASAGRHGSDADLLAQVARRGVARCSLLDGPAVRAALDLLDGLSLDPAHPFFASPAQDWGRPAADVQAALTAIAGPAIAARFPGHRVFVAGFTSKGTDGIAVPFHQDWTYTDERRHRALFLWVPLVDTDETNGGLAAVPGSHRWATGIRPGRRVDPTVGSEEPLDGLQSRLAAVAEPLTVAAGDAVAFDPGMIHGSTPNRSGRVRPAFTIGMVPSDADLLHFHQAPDGPLLGYRVDVDFFTHNPYGCAPAGPPTVTPWTASVTTDDYLPGLAERERSGVAGGVG